MAGFEGREMIIVLDISTLNFDLYVGLIQVGLYLGVDMGLVFRVRLECGCLFPTVLFLCLLMQKYNHTFASLLWILEN